MKPIDTLADHFLIAMPSMDDPNFSRAVIYVCEHNEKGAIGIIINRPLEQIRLADVFEQVDIESDNTLMNDMPVLFGGPMQQERGFVLHSFSAEWQSSIDINENVSVTTSKDVLEAIAKGEGPSFVTIALGYAGWGKGQLEEEIKKNSWLVAPANSNILFKVPYSERWQAAATSIGVDMERVVSTDVGHA